MRYILESDVDGTKNAIVLETIPASIVLRLYREDDPVTTKIAEKVVL